MTTPPPVRLATVAFLLTLAACKDSTPPRVATTIVASPASIVFDAVGATQGVTVAVNDQHGDAMTNVSLAWTSASPTVALVSGGGSGAATGTVTSASNGSTAVSVAAGSARAVIPVTVAQVPVAPVKGAGDAQTAVVGSTLPTELRVRVQDRLGNAISGNAVTFTAPTGSGSVSATGAVTGVDGSAGTTWTIGTVPGTHSVVVAAQGAATTATFTAFATVGPPASLAASTGDNQTAVAGTAVAVPPAVRVVDQFGNPVPGVNVAFVAAAGSGTVTGGAAMTNASGIATVGGWTLGATVGSKTLTATVTGLGPVVITATAVAGPPAAAVVSSGNNQSAAAGGLVPVSPAVRVNDANGNGVSGVSVTFAVASGGGAVTGASATTNVNGVATVGSWALGPVAGTNTLTATVAASGISGNPVTFTATGTAAPVGGPFNIELRYITPGTATQVAAFTAAVARWQSIITADVSDVLMNRPAGQCGSNAPAITETIDDLLIFVTLEAIDGPGGALASAGPCFVRSANGLPIVGRMRFDTADLDALEASGRLGYTILHEMGHIIGIGTIWNLPPVFSFLVNPSLPSSPGVDTHYSGANGIAGFNLVGGATYTGGGKVPVENTQGGQGTRDSHWRESVFDTELMTGFLDAGTNPLSVMTIRSLQDFGYTVSTAPAEAYFVTLTAALRAGPKRGVALVDDVTNDPIGVVDERGRVIRVIRVNQQPRE